MIYGLQAQQSTDFEQQNGQEQRIAFLADKTHGDVRTAHILAFQTSNVALACVQVPAQLV
jgi:hypothetical protein